ncbi:MAG: Sua5/YciO/YrdC/YwlC family protein, partial [Gaiellaceae bacterium]
MIVDEVAEAIEAGQPAIVPVDTVYGLVASVYTSAPARAVYRLKGRPESQPAALMASDLDLLFECVPELRGRAGTIARALLPGAYTLVLPNPSRRFRWITGERPETIGVRVPVLEGDARGLLDRVGAVMATSASLSGGPEPRTLAEVPDELKAACAVLD